MEFLFSRNKYLRNLLDKNLEIGGNVWGVANGTLPVMHMKEDEISKFAALIEVVSSIVDQVIEVVKAKCMGES